MTIMALLLARGLLRELLAAVLQTAGNLGALLERGGGVRIALELL
jgi:hypothetical protein